jgi:acetylglutamate kinase
MTVRAIGLSGKDGRLAVAKKRWHMEAGQTEKIDLGQVGDVAKMDPKVIFDLLHDDLIPIVAPIAMGQDKENYNVNADMFAGHLAGALKAYAYVVLTDVQGLMEDKDRPETQYKEIDRSKMDGLMNTVVQGGMIPKVESCLIALDKGVSTARIVNGMQPHSILEELLTETRSGTMIH